MIWNTFGPISESVLAVFCPEWTEATLALLGNWGNIMYIVPIVPVIWDHTQLNLKRIFNNVFDRVLLCRVHSGKTIENLIEIPIEIQLNCAPPRFFEAKGLRASIVLTGLLMSAGTLLRCLPLRTDMFTV